MLGKELHSPEISLPELVKLDYRSHLTEELESIYQLVILDRTPTSDECALLLPVTQAYTLFYTEHVNLNLCQDYLTRKLGKRLKSVDLPHFLQEDALWFFPQSYGEKFQMENLAVSHSFSGEIYWHGNYALQLSGEFGERLSQVAFWRNQIPVETGQTLDLWLEYHATPGVEISLQGVLLAPGQLCHVLQTWEFSQKDMEHIMHIRAEKKGHLFVSIQAKGKECLDIVALHDRYSRGKYGYFIPGCERYVTSQREEIFCYFNPGDLKPPLCVYFSGYKTRQGFEGYHMLRGMGVPFLLIAEARLEGGSFYIGSEEYERLMVHVIQRHMDLMGFSKDEVILSGVSMGYTGALYYGCDLMPHAIIAGKPLLNIGAVALNEKRNRPGGFPTSLDVLLVHGGDTTDEAADQLNHRFWSKFEKTDWSKTKLILSYMQEDDYDMHAYEMMVWALSNKNAQIYGRGLHGRHNDNTVGIMQWFTSQYKKLLHEDFSQYDSEFRQEM